MKKRWMVCALLLIVAVTLLTTVAFAGTGGFRGILFELYDDWDLDGEGWNWDASERTLTLENADISEDWSIFSINTDNAVLVLKGENKLEARADRIAIKCEGDLSVTGDGSLTVTSSLVGIAVEGSLGIRDTVVVFDVVDNPIICYNLRVTNSKVKINKAAQGVYADGNCWFTNSEIIIESEFIGLVSHGKKVVIKDSVFKVESDDDGMVVYGSGASVLDSEVYLNSDGRAFLSYLTGGFSSNISIRAGKDADNLKPAEYGRFENYRTFLVDGEPAKVVHIDPTDSAFALIAAIESTQNAQIPFSDVTAQTEYYDAITEAYNRGLMGGVSATEFAPDETLTRAMVWTVLARANGVNTEIGATWDSAGRDWAMREKVSDGTDPNGAVTVEELVTMAWRNVGSPYRVADLGNANVSVWAVEAMRWAYETGILSRGIDPKSNATRALTAHVLTAG